MPLPSSKSLWVFILLINLLVKFAYHQRVYGSLVITFTINSLYFLIFFLFSVRCLIAGHYLCISFNALLSVWCKALNNQWIIQLSRQSVLLHFQWVMSYRLIPFLFNFIDVDECSSGDNPCINDDLCINTPGSHKCVCRADLMEPSCDAGTTCIYIVEAIFFVRFLGFSWTCLFDKWSSALGCFTQMKTSSIQSLSRVGIYCVAPSVLTQVGSVFSSEKTYLFLPPCTTRSAWNC